MCKNSCVCSTLTHHETRVLSNALIRFVRIRYIIPFFFPHFPTPPQVIPASEPVSRGVGPLILS